MSRRTFVATAATTVVAPTLLAATGERAGAPVSSEALVRLSAMELAAQIKARNVSCREVMQSYLGRIDRFNPRLNAIVSLQDRDDLLRQAQERDDQLARGHYLGWMHGFPHAVKDMTATAGIRTTLGSALTDSIPTQDGILVERIKKHGAIIIGKTNTPEFGLGSQTYNSVFGTTLNPYDLKKTCGGSSGGAAVSLASNLVPVADGSDMMGSLRNPAAFNNVFGFRPSFGRIPTAGKELYLGQLTCHGPMGRSVADVSMFLSVLAGPDSRMPLALQEPPDQFTASLKHDVRGLRLGWLGDLGGYLPLESGMQQTCERALKDFEHLGCVVKEVALPVPPAQLWDTWLTLRHWLVTGDLGDLYDDPGKRSQLKPEARWEVEGGLALTARDVYRASAARSGWYKAAQLLFQQVDFLVLPSAQVFPFDATVHWPAQIAGRSMDTYHRWMEVVVPASLLSGPVLGVPAGFGPQGLPAGLQLIGPHNSDLSVLQLGHAYDQLTRWPSRSPPALRTDA